VTSPTNETGKKTDLNTAAGIIFLVLGVCFTAWYILQMPPGLNRSVLGLNGLLIYGKQSGIDIRSVEGNDNIEPENIGLRIIPLYLPDTTRWRNETNVDKKRKQYIRRTSQWSINQKVARENTLIIAPKWRYGAVSEEKLHPKLLMNASAIHLPFKGGPRRRDLIVKQGSPQLEHVQYSSINDFDFKPDYTLELYAAQTLKIGKAAKSTCKALIAVGDRALLTQCETDRLDGKYYYLSDPDVLNNHGAVRGDNIRFALDLIKNLSGGKLVLIDHTNKSLKTVRAKKTRSRSIKDLLRFFEYPFSLFWLGLGVLCIYTFWHSWRRFGPATTGESDNIVLASKRTVIDANVHILRSAGNDPALAKLHVIQRLHLLSSDILGKHRKRGDQGVAQIKAAVTRRNSSLGKKLARQMKAINATYTSTGLVRQLKDFELTLQEIRNEFGKSTSTGQ